MHIRLVILSSLLAVSGCTTTGMNSGPLSVAPTGQNVSNNGKVAATIITAMNGGLVGGAVGSTLTAREKRSALEAEYKALEYTASGQPVTWKGEQASHFGEAVAAQPYRVGSQDCRQYTQTVNSGATPTVARGTACRNADGSWTPLT